MEVDPDVEAIKAQMRKDLEAKMQNDISTEALDKAREEAEAAARAQLQVGASLPRAGPVHRTVVDGWWMPGV